MQVLLHVKTTQRSAWQGSLTCRPCGALAPLRAVHIEHWNGKQMHATFAIQLTNAQSTSGASHNLRTFSSGCPSVCWPLPALEASVSGCLPALLLPLLGVGAVYSWVSTPVDLVLGMRSIQRVSQMMQSCSKRMHGGT